MKPNRIKSKDVYKHLFYQVPKEFFVQPNYRELTSDSILLYSILKDRMELSKENGWVNENDEIYLIFTRDDLCVLMNKSKPTIIKAFKQLVQFGLIDDVRQGLKKPNLIYICDIETSMNTLKSTSFTSGSKTSLPLEVKEFYSNDTNINNTYINKSVSQDGRTENPTIVEEILENSQASVFYEDNRLLIEETVRTICTDKNIALKLKIGLTNQQIRDRILTLQIRHLDRAINKYQHHKHNVTNTVIYFAKILIESIGVAGVEELKYDDE